VVKGARLVRLARFGLARFITRAVSRSKTYSPGGL
jgi:hypothetical protein